MNGGTVLKIDRLIGILSILLQREKATSAELAEKFEVSQRTIIRDMEAINAAGIPVAAVKGKGGGFYIMEGYKVDSRLLSHEDIRSVFAGLNGLDSISKNNRYKQLMDKLYTRGKDGSQVKNDIIIDLGGWDKAAVSEKIELIREAIGRGEKIFFSYFSPSGDSQREIEPYHLIYQWAGWYVWGYCCLRKDYRMFKLTRLTDIKLTGEHRENRDVPMYSCSKLMHSEGGREALVRFDKSVKWRIIDEFGTEIPDFDSSGGCTLKFTWKDIPSFYEYILSFGNNAEIIYPEEYREGIGRLAAEIFDKHVND